MYLHLGQNEIVPDHRIIGIFDLDKCTYGKRTREYLAAAEKEGVVLDISGDIPKSFVICDHPYHPQIVYLSQLNAATLQKRAESRKMEL
ncbi:extracellular matrix regulator RemB [uncultured Dysosmobacter sp.]|uniref:extracellular matrix regulator RemB n=1 Tax=uncultured Dysosmobacter sp. TaxID=2591384 RepID=UPI0026044BDA|nr:extracellular matrix/biofilm biosynthesis regulator RemA family protein [uncultured Dysosmobacter sp.]